MRRAIVTEDLRTAAEIVNHEDEIVPFQDFLRNTVEKQSEVISIEKLHRKVVRQRKEIEQWA